MTTKIDIQTASEKAAVMLAFDRGEQVEWRNRDSAIWLNDYDPSWDWHHYDWRVEAAKPIEYWIWVHSNGLRDPDSYDSKTEAEHAYNGLTGRAVFMREVIE